ncbi:unnamed protein product [Adineta steineri]|uniref:PDZ domain-containing protein n=1 Tax=Adineta steineri TaxID=433720 RepID=A0A816FJQ7_9BILA|nr:unnamed protein product [Adineta steineri]CAF1662276.1 unnamed protein product [Adineta steineri]
MQLIRRLSPPITKKIDIQQHDGKLGITLKGGIGTQFYPNDHGIFITNTCRQQTGTQLEIGDRLLEIASTKKQYDLRFVTRERAIKSIELACKESQKVTLSVGRAKRIIPVQNQKSDSCLNELNSTDTKNKDMSKVHVGTQYATTNGIRNERKLCNTSGNYSHELLTIQQGQSYAIKLITPSIKIDLIYDHEDNRNTLKVSIDQQKNLTITPDLHIRPKISSPVFVSDFIQDTDQRQLELEEATRQKQRYQENYISSEAYKNKESETNDDNEKLRRRYDDTLV